MTNAWDSPSERIRIAKQEREHRQRLTKMKIVGKHVCREFPGLYIEAVGADILVLRRKPE